ncbi:hypothetical protein DQ240_21885 [Blastococcus sp. TF02A-26]|nr:hypothetical protein DQ240_21885 [Blastococcus sp. TF02A-26]
MRTALLAAVLAAGVTGCAETGDDAAAPAPTAGVGPDRPGAGGDELVVDPLPLDAPVLLDRVPDGLLLTEFSYQAPDAGYEPFRATLYGDPALTDTLDGPVLLVGTSSGSAQIGGPRYEAPGQQVDIGGRTGAVVADGDRTWVVIQSNDYVEFVVGRGIDDDELVEAARGADFESPTATVAPDAVPAGLEPLIAGGPPDGPGGPGQHVFLLGETTWVSVVAVQADPRLAALWGFWADDATGTTVRGAPGSAGVLRGTYLGGPEAPGRVWAEDGLVLAVIATLDRAGQGADLVDQVVRALRVGTWAEFDATRRQLLERPPTRAEAGCGADSGFVSGVEGDHRWGFAVYAHSLSGQEEWSACYMDIGGGGGGGTLGPPPPVGEVAIHPGGPIVGGVAPPGTARVTVTAPDGSTHEAVLSDVGPRPGERVWGMFLPDLPPPATSSTPPYVFWSMTATAYDASGAVLDSTSV